MSKVFKLINLGNESKTHLIGLGYSTKQVQILASLKEFECKDTKQKATISAISYFTNISECKVSHQKSSKYLAKSSTFMSDHIPYENVTSWKKDSYLQIRKQIHVKYESKKILS